MIASFTPGPWKISTDRYDNGAWPFEGGFNGIIRAEGGYVIYRGPASFNALRGRSPEEAKANAQLIAAAPDLLAACEHVVQLIDPGEWPDAYQELKAAIAKAKGAP
jgi:hypothetical protein